MTDKKSTAAAAAAADAPLAPPTLGDGLENKDLATTVGELAEATNRAGNVELVAIHHLDLPGSGGEVKTILPGEDFKVDQGTAAGLIAAFRAKLA